MIVHEIWRSKRERRTRVFNSDQEGQKKESLFSSIGLILNIYLVLSIWLVRVLFEKSRIKGLGRLE